MSYSTRGSGGGGGFGGFPFRSSHQQGNDNNRNNNNNNSNRRNKSNRTNKVANRRKRGGPITCRARIQVPASLRKYLIGQKGTTIRAITEGTRCIVDVPGKKQVDNDRAMVEVKASCVDFLLHGCWEVLKTVVSANALNDHDHDHENDHGNKYSHDMEVNYTLEIGGVSFRGKHSHIRSNGAFMLGNTSASDNGHDGMAAYYISICESVIDEIGVSNLVDNERFVDPKITAKLAITRRSLDLSRFDDLLKETMDTGDAHNTDLNVGTGTNSDLCSTLLIFIYGSQQDKTRKLYEKILHTTSSLKSLQRSDQS